jgi:sodium-dependent dicarboxylate transporter 2/3/5
MSFSAARIGLFLGPVLFFLTRSFFHPQGLSDAGNAVLASTFWIACWWITEALPIAVTALLPIVLFPLTGALSISDTTAQFGHKYIFLYMGGFIIAIAIEKWGLHRRIALRVIDIIGSNVVNIILGFMVATAFMSMWISNTATAVMMLPIGMAIITQLKDNPATIEDENKIFGKALMLSIAYSASIGGMATLIGTPPNLVLAGVVSETYGVEITFAQWISFGLPISIILLLISWKYLTSFAFTFKQKSFPGGRQEIRRLLKGLGKMRREEVTVLIVFGLTALLWISRSILQTWVPALDDTMIAIASGVSLFILPSATPGERIINWDEAVRMPWGIILLFGGGMALAQGFSQTGLANWIGGQMTALQGLSIFLIILLLIAAVNFLTEITSNLATTAMLLPILAPMALSIDVHPYILLVSATVAASCAFMLPVATPPNAVVFGSGYLRIPDMVRAGLWMNLISIVLLSIIVYFLLPYLWDFIPKQYPAEFR